MSNSEHISLRIDPELKAQVEQVLKSLGLTQSEAIKIYYRQILLNNGLPFPIQLPLKTNVTLTKKTSDKIKSKNPWEVLEDFSGTIEAPEDWSDEHDHYIYGTPKKNLK